MQSMCTLGPSAQCSAQVKLIINRWAWALVPQVGGAGQSTAGKEVSMVTLKRPPPTWALSHWRTQWNTHQRTTRFSDLPKGRVGGAKIAKLASNCASEMSLQMTAKRTLRVKVTKGPCEGPGPPQLYAASGSGPLRISDTKCPCKPPEAVSEFPTSKGCQRALLWLCLNYI